MHPSRNGRDFCLSMFIAGSGNCERTIPSVLGKTCEAFIEGETLESYTKDI